MQPPRYVRERLLGLNAVNTETEAKLRDAGIQMKLALQNGVNEDVFRSCINAFITAARSVTMVMQRESAHNEPLLAWYKLQTESLGRTPLFRFFNSQRTYTIHRGVIQPSNRTYPVRDYQRGQPLLDGGRLLETGTFTLADDDFGMHPDDVFFAVGQHAAIFWSFPEARTFFPDESANVIRLCEQYFLALKRLVQEWLVMRAAATIL